MVLITDQYEPDSIEPKWQAYWEEHRTFSVPNPGEPGFDASKPKYYVLDMFPYPSGAGLHVGHPEGYTATDILARYYRHRGYNVLHPMGYDSFGLPAEQYAVEHGVHPAETTKRNIDNIRRQIKMLGFSYDWNRELATTDEPYYRWTQWIFRLMFESWYDSECEWTGPDDVRRVGRARPIGELVVPDDVKSQGQPAVDEYVNSRRLAYIDEVPVNWCPALGTVLANEEVTNEGRSERGNHPVFRRPLRQWMLRITEYADRLERDLETVDWPESIRIMQRNWIGRSEGADIEFPIAGRDDSLRVFTTRPDTVFGATYMVIAPEHQLVDELTTDAQLDAVRAYREAAARKSDLERTELQKDKTGVFSGAYAINPVNDKQIPIWIADYVLATYGTGAIMAVPGQDERDWEFAEKFDLPIIRTVQPPADFDGKAYVGEGPAINSGFLNGLNVTDAKAKIINWLETNGRGSRRVNYKLRDWLFSRQRYWGEPFPILHDESGRIISVPEDELPVRLPEMRDFSPQSSDDPSAPPQPPLSQAPDDWLEVKRSDGRTYTREVNTMPQWAGSCWYYLRYLDAQNDTCFVGKEAEEYWMPVDLYVGGAEHAVLHLLYARFWHKVLFDLGHVHTSEPFSRLFNQGMIRSFAYRDARGVPIAYDDINFREDGPHHRKTGEKLTESVEKMAKSLKNVVNPETVVHEYGADTLRLYEMYMGPLESSKPWNPRDVPGVYRFLQRAWRLIVDDRTGRLASAVTDDKPDEATERLIHRTIKEVEEDIVAMKFNTAIAELIKFVNEMTPRDRRPKSVLERFVLLLSPFAPHLAEELWQRLRGDAWTGTLAYEAWPVFDPGLAKHDEVEIAVQINGKVKAKFTIDVEASEDQMREAALADARVAAQIAGKTIRLVKCVPGRLVNIVVG